MLGPELNSVKTGEKSVSSRPRFASPLLLPPSSALELAAAWPGAGERSPGVRGERGVACVIIAGDPASSSAGARTGVSAPAPAPAPLGVPDQSILLRLPRMLPRGDVGGASAPSPPAPFWRGDIMLGPEPPLLTAASERAES